MSATTRFLFSDRAAGRPMTPLIVFCLLLPAVVALGGCFKMTLESPPPAPVRTHPLQEARNAYVRGDYARSETAALRLSKDSSLSGGEKTEVFRVLAAAALRNNHPNVALGALEELRKVSPGADRARDWQDTWCKALRSLSSHDARTRANEVYQDGSREQVVRSVAGVFLAVRQWKDGEMGQSMLALENIYTSANSVKDKAVIEARLALELHLADASAARLAFSAVTDENRTAFPYNIIAIDELRRRSRDASTRAEAAAELEELSRQTVLADPSLFKSPPTEGGIRIEGTGASSSAFLTGGRPVVLTLPLSGDYAVVSTKIIAGAQVACDELSSAGKQVSLVVIDTEQADWIAKVDALPQDAVVIGGPLRRNDYSRAKAQGLLSRRAVFAFLPGLEQGDEGRTAWRFFSSAQDQVDTLLGFTSRLGIKGYAVFYPRDTFGSRMASLFEESAKARGVSGVFSNSYDPVDQNNWMAEANNLFSSSGPGAFRAIFLPDSWKNMDVLVSNLFYYKETRHLLLGTSLWEQGLGSGSYVSMQYYKLAVFPGSWNSSQLSSAGMQLNSLLTAAGKEPADLWTGLGYDFARMSAGLDLRPGWTPGTVNAALQSASLSWSMAPISWNNGVASQKMFLFTPSENGFVPVDEQAFRSAFEEAWR